MKLILTPDQILDTLMVHPDDSHNCYNDVDDQGNFILEKDDE